MKVDEWLLFFKTHPEKKLFRLSDLTQLIDEPQASLCVQLTRLTNAHLLTRVAQGWYANPFSTPSAEEVAMVLRVPSYLSLEYALSRHGVLSQRAYTLTLVTTRAPYTFQKEHHRYEYHQISPSLFWGYDEEQGVLVGTPEKALLDLLYLRGVRTKDITLQGFRSLLDDMELELLHRQRLQDYASRFGRGTETLAAQLGLLLR